MRCPLDTACNSLVKANELALHCKAEHPKKCFTFEDRILLEVSRPTEDVLLFEDEYTYILQIRKVKSYINHTLKLTMCLQFVGNDRNRSYNYYELILETKEGDVAHKFECVINIFPKNNCYLGIELDLQKNSPLKYEGKIVSAYKIKIYKDAVIWFKELMTHFVCPVCFKMMSDDILTCENGHNICDTCGKQVKLCPICRNTKKRFRNIQLSHMADLIQKLDA